LFVIKQINNISSQMILIKIVISLIVDVYRLLYSFQIFYTSLIKISIINTYCHILYFINGSDIRIIFFWNGFDIIPISNCVFRSTPILMRPTIELPWVIALWCIINFQRFSSFFLNWLLQNFLSLLFEHTHIDFYWWILRSLSTCRWMGN